MRGSCIHALFIVTSGKSFKIKTRKCMSPLIYNFRLSFPYTYIRIPTYMYAYVLIDI